MKQPFSVRVGTLADYDALCELFEILDEHHRVARPDIYRKPIGPRRPRGHVQFLMNRNTGIVFVAQASKRTNNLIGFANVLIRDQLELPIRAARKVAEIENMVVRPEHRHNGTGKALLKAACDWARQKGFESVELQVDEFNSEARGFYEAVGFKTLRRRMERETSSGPLQI